MKGQRQDLEIQFCWLEREGELVAEAIAET